MHISVSFLFFRLFTCHDSLSIQWTSLVIVLQSLIISRQMASSYWLLFWKNDWMIRPDHFLCLPFDVYAFRFYYDFPRHCVLMYTCTRFYSRISIQSMFVVEEWDLRVDCVSFLLNPINIMVSTTFIWQNKSVGL